MFTFIVGMLYDNPTGDEGSDEATTGETGAARRGRRRDRPGRGLSL